MRMIHPEVVILIPNRKLGAVTRSTYCTFDPKWQPGLWISRISCSFLWDYCRAGQKIRSPTWGMVWQWLLAKICLVVDYLTKRTFAYHNAISITNYLSIFSNLEFQNPKVKITTTLSLPHLRIGGALFSASTHAIDSDFDPIRSLLSHSSPSELWDRIINGVDSMGRSR